MVDIILSGIYIFFPELKDTLLSIFKSLSIYNAKNISIFPHKNQIWIKYIIHKKSYQKI